MKESLTRARSTGGRDVVLGFALVVAVNVLIIVDPWHIIRTKWPALRVLETITAVVISIIVLGLLGAFLREVARAAASDFWPTMYSLVDWHRKRAEKRKVESKSVPARCPPTRLDNLLHEARVAIRCLFWGVLAVGIIWGIRSCRKALYAPDDHRPVYSSPRE
jgi:hypothetical protein